MQKLNETYKPADGQSEGGLRVLGIALDDAGGKVVKPFYAKLKITYPMLADPPSAAAAPGIAATAKDMKKRYGVQEIPVVYLIDSTGTITHAHVGFKKEFVPELDAAVKAVVGRPRDETPAALGSCSRSPSSSWPRGFSSASTGSPRKAITVCLDCIGIG